MKSILFCGGGTAGHVMPNIAIIEALKDKNIDIHYIGSNAIEKDILKEYKYVKFHEINPPKLIRKITLKNLSIPFKLIHSINTCRKLIKEIQPDVIFSKGGYVSVPVVMASKDIPVYGHESDYTMGLANKIIYRYCNNMFFSFQDTYLKYHKKGIFSGTPIRKDIFNGNKNIAKNKLHINNNKTTILVVGGSTGANYINNFIYSNRKALSKDYNVIHITGKGKNSFKPQQCYYPLEYVPDIENYLDLADIIISRAGSNAIFEFLALKKNMILIPLPKDQSRGDQLLNAEYFYKNKFAEVIEQENLSLPKLQEKIEKLKIQKFKYKSSMDKYDLKNGTNIIIKKLIKHLK